MLAQGLEKLRDEYGSAFSIWDYEEEFEIYRDFTDIPYRLVIKCDKWVGNFERELIGYAFGILDGVQMDIDYALDERKLFWKEVFHYQDGKTIEFADEYELLDKYLFETFQTVADWEQITFYNVIGINKNESAIIVQFSEVPPLTWTSLIASRIKDFFVRFETSTAKGSKLLACYFEDSKKRIVKDLL